MKYVVITKTFADIGPSKVYPPNWPAQCEEFESLEEAQAKYPGKRALTNEQYAYYVKGLEDAQKGMVVKRPSRLKRFFGVK